MSQTLGTREKEQLRQCLQLYTKLLKLAESKGVRLDKNEEDWLLKLTEDVHKMIYE